MRLTPELVREWTFPTQRLREGYSVADVRSFLDLIADEVARLTRENTTLRARAAAEADSREVTAAPISPKDAAVRVLALAEETARRITTEAEEEAQATLGKAREEAESIERTARSQADVLDTQAQAQYHRALSRLDVRREELQQSLTELEAFEAEQRTRLAAYLRLQLAQLETSASTQATRMTGRSVAQGVPLALGAPVAAADEGGAVLISPWKTKAESRVIDQHTPTRRVGPAAVPSHLPGVPAFPSS